MGAEGLGIGGVGADGAVAVAGDEAEEAEGLPVVGVELMPRLGRNGDQVEGGEPMDGLADERAAPALQDHHRMDVRVPLERRMPPRRDLEVPELARQVLPLAEEHLPRDAAKMGAFRLVRQDRHRLPPIAVVSCPKRTNRRCVLVLMLVHLALLMFEKMWE